MLEATRVVGWDRINGNFVQAARYFRVEQIVIHNQLPKPCFFVTKEDLGNDYSQKGILHLSVADLGKIKFPDSFKLNDIDRLIFPGRTVFTRTVEIGRIKVGEGTVIGAETKIGPHVTIHEGVEIGPNCRIEYSEIGKESKIGAGAKIGSADIREKVEIGPDAFIAKYGVGRVEIGSGVRIGAGFLIPDRTDLVIEPAAVIGDYVTILSEKVGVISAGARIENGTIIQGRSIAAGEMVRTKDAPDILVAFSGKLYEKPPENTHLSQVMKQMIAALKYYRQDNYDYDYTANASRAASRSLSRDPALFLYPQVHPLPERKLFRVVGKKEAVVFFNDRKRSYFGAKEIPEQYIAEEKSMDEQEYRRLSRFSFALLTGLKANKISDQKFIDGGFREECYGVTPLDNFYMLMDHLRVKLGWEEGQMPRFLDLGSGLADVVKVADAFTQAEGIEKDKARFQLALKYAKGKANLHYGSFFDYDLSVYDLLYLHMNWGDYELSKGVYRIPFVQKLKKKFTQLKPGAMVIVGPIKIKDCFYNIAIHDTPGVASRILSNLQPVDLDLPDEIVGLFALFKK